MSYTFSRSLVCNNTTTSYQDVTGYLVLLCFHLPALWSQPLLITFVWLWIHHQAPTFTYLLNSGLSNSDQWFLNYAPFIRFLCSGRGDVKFCFDLSHYYPVCLTIIFPDNYTIHLQLKPWVRPNTSSITEISPSLLIPFCLGGGLPLLGISQVVLTEISWLKNWLVAIYLCFQPSPSPYCVHPMGWSYAHFHHKKIIQIIITPQGISGHGLR